MVVSGQGRGGGGEVVGVVGSGRGSMVVGV